MVESLFHRCLERDFAQEVNDEIPSLRAEVERLQWKHGKEGKYSKKLSRLKSSMQSLEKELSIKYKGRKRGKTKKTKKTNGASGTRLQEIQKESALLWKMVHEMEMEGKIRTKEEEIARLENMKPNWLKPKRRLKGNAPKSNRKRGKRKKHKKAGFVSSNASTMGDGPISVGTSTEPEIGLWHTLNRLFDDGEDYDKIGTITEKDLRNAFDQVDEDEYVFVFSSFLSFECAPICHLILIYLVFICCIDVYPVRECSVWLNSRNAALCCESRNSITSLM